MTRTYECMFLIDNDAVRAGWNDVKAYVSGLVSKHGGSIATARRWGERRLAYTIRHKNRATYLLAYCDLDPSGFEALRRDLDMSERVLRYLILGVDEIPAEERELAAAEESPEFAVPEPPADDSIEEPQGADDSSDDDSDDSDDDDDDDRDKRRGRRPIAVSSEDED